MLQRVASDLPQSKWLFINIEESFDQRKFRPGPTSSGWDGFYGVSLRICIVEASNRLAIGLEYPVDGTRVNETIFDSFWAEVHLKVARQREKGNINPLSLHSFVRNIVYHVILNNGHQVLSQIEYPLCTIDAEMKDDEEVRRCIAHWRKAVGGWRAHLHSRVKFAEQMKLVLPVAGLQNEMSWETDLILGQGKNQTIRSLHGTLKARTGQVITHCEATFTALMSTMSIFESEKGNPKSRKCNTSHTPGLLLHSNYCRRWSFWHEYSSYYCL